MEDLAKASDLTFTKETRKKPIKSTKKARKRKRNFQGGKREQKKEPPKNPLCAISETP